MRFTGTAFETGKYCLVLMNLEDCYRYCFGAGWSMGRRNDRLCKMDTGGHFLSQKAGTLWDMFQI